MLLGRKRDRGIAAIKAAEMLPVLEAEIEEGTRSGRAIDWASEITGVGVRQISLVLQVKKASPAMLERVKAGELSLHWAYDHLIGSEARRRKKYREDRDKPVPPSPESLFESRSRAASSKLVVREAEARRMVVACSQISGLAKGLGSLKVDRILSVTSEADVTYWVGALNEAAVNLREFKKKLGVQNHERKTGGTGAAQEGPNQDGEGSGQQSSGASDSSEAGSCIVSEVDDRTSGS